MHKVHWNDEEKKFYVMDDGRMLNKFPTMKATANYLKNKGITRYEMTANALRAAKRQNWKG